MAKSNLALPSIAMTLWWVYALQYFLFPLQCARLASLYLEQFTGFDPEKRGKASASAQGFAVPADNAGPPPVPDENNQGRAGRIGKDVQSAW